MTMSSKLGSKFKWEYAIAGLMIVSGILAIAFIFVAIWANDESLKDKSAGTAITTGIICGISVIALSEFEDDDE